MADVDTVSKIVAVIGASALFLGLGAGVAAAHVTVNPGETTAGSYAKLTFRVPTESATADTVALTVSLPADHPFGSVSLQPVPGWTAQTERTTFDPPVAEGDLTLTDAVTSITWTADGDGIKPGEFQEFSISVGPVPETDVLHFPATQTYSDGAVVAWDGIAAPGVDPHSLDRPAPRLAITASSHDPGHADSSAASTSSGDATAQLLGALGLVLGALALVVAVVAWRRAAPRRVGAAQ